MTKLSLLRALFTPVLLIVALVSGLSAQAATYVNHTRLIINEKERDVTFSVINQGTTPALMQLWSDRDNLLDRPETIKMPFIISPPVFRLDADKSRTVRIQWTGDDSGLSKTEESLFWLNVLEVPPKSDVKGEGNMLQMAFRTRIKLFYRPAAVSKAVPEEGVKQLRSSTVSCGENTCLRLSSVSPLHITLLDVTLTNGTKITALPADGMIAPFSTLDIPLSRGTGAGQLQAATWIDDYGVARHDTQ